MALSFNGGICADCHCVNGRRANAVISTLERLIPPFVKHFAQTQPEGHSALDNAHFCIEHFGRAEEGQRIVGRIEELNLGRALCILGAGRRGKSRPTAWREMTDNRGRIWWMRAKLSS